MLQRACKGVEDNLWPVRGEAVVTGDVGAVDGEADIDGAGADVQGVDHSRQEVALLVPFLGVDTVGTVQQEHDVGGIGTV